MATLERAKRLKNLPPYLFKEIDRKKAEVIAKGADIIDLGIGDPDLPTPKHIIEALKRAVEDPATHRYPSYSGMKAFREAVAQWYADRFGVKLDPDKEVICLIGSKEGIAHLPLAFLDPGDVALLPSPGYPVYNASTLFACATPHFMPLSSGNKYLPDFDAVSDKIAKRARLMFINYPNNPTSAVTDLGFFQKVVRFAKDHHILVAHDAAYTEVAYEDYRPQSFLEARDAMEVGLEFHSLSKTFNMTGWRVGFAVGNREAIEGLGAVKSNVDSGVFEPVQRAGIQAILGDQTCVEEMRRVYERRRDLMVDGLRKAGFKLEKPKATFYLWVEVPEGSTSTEFVTRLLEEAGVVVTPGNGFGEPGEGYFRIALTQKRERLREALERLKKVNW